MRCGIWTPQLCGAAAVHADGGEFGVPLWALLHPTAWAPLHPTAWALLHPTAWALLHPTAWACCHQLVTHAPHTPRALMTEALCWVVGRPPRQGSLASSEGRCHVEVRKHTAAGGRRGGGTAKRLKARDHACSGGVRPGNAGTSRWRASVDSYFWNSDVADSAFCSVRVEAQSVALRQPGGGAPNAIVEGTGKMHAWHNRSITTATPNRARGRDGPSAPHPPETAGVMSVRSRRLGGNSVRDATPLCAHAL